MEFERAYKSFMLAINEMVTSPKSIQKRVGDAYIYRLIYLEPEDLPEEIRFKFTCTVERLTSVKSEDNVGSVEATVNKLTPEEAVEIAIDIVGMWDVLNMTHRKDTICIDE